MGREPEAAQLRVLEWFRQDFMRRHPTGLVLTEYEYMGRTTAAPVNPGPLRTSNAALNAVLDGLSTNFRRFITDRDFRKCDILGISGSGQYAELIEVTTEGNAPRAITQLNEKLQILRSTVNKQLKIAVDWRPATWRPADNQLFMMLPPAGRGVRWVCYMPTRRAKAPDGIVLYEIHSLNQSSVPVTIPVPADIRNKLREKLQKTPLQQGSEQKWAREFFSENPILKGTLRALLVLGAAAMFVVAIVAVFDPVPGDEVAAFMTAMALVRQATE